MDLESVGLAQWTLTLIAPSGVRIEGLAVEQAAHLLRLPACVRNPGTVTLVRDLKSSES